MAQDLWNKIKILFSGQTLRSKLLWIYFLLLLLPLGLITGYSLHRFSEVVQLQTLTSAQKNMDDTASILNNYLDRLEGVLNILAADSTIYRVSSQKQADHPYSERLKDSMQAATTFQHLQSLSDTDRILLYVQNNYLYTNKQHILVSTEEIEDSGWYLQMNPASTSNWFAPCDFADQTKEEQHWFSAMRMIYSPEYVERPLAIIRADISEERILESIRSTPVTPNGFFLLLRDGDLLLSSLENESGLPQGLDAQTCLKDLSACSGQASWAQQRLGGKNYYVQYRKLNHSGWQLATVLPLDDVFALSRELRLEMLLAVCALGSMAYLLAFAISRSTLQRISLLAQTMHAVEAGNVTARPEPSGQDEIGQLMSSFIHMMNRMDILMEEKVEYGRQIKNLELKALQAQINPHFLYNSLDLISCTAIMRNVPEITKMVNKLARFYKLSLSQGNEIIPLANELTHAKLYIEIQNMRFEDRIQVTWNVEEALLDYQIIKIVLQPILENAAIHGIFEKPDKTGHISVRVCRRGSDIAITVEDDGVGMSGEILHTNFDASPSGITVTSGGYGVRNINDRLHLAYGDTYGLSCESTPGKGTTVTILIPAVKSEA